VGDHTTAELPLGGERGGVPATIRLKLSNLPSAVLINPNFRYFLWTPHFYANNVESMQVLETLKAAIDNLDWRYVTLSRRRYGNTYVCTGLGDSHWLERPFAYEIYHQLRLIWAAGQFDLLCLIQAEVLKKYQGIRDITKMPDLLFHDPKSDHNLAVIEIKLASNTDKNLKADLEKLALFRRALRYETLVEILIGSDAELLASHEYVRGLSFDCDAPIHILTVSLDDHRTNILQVNNPTPI
jgi:hypothetical protein